MELARGIVSIINNYCTFNYYIIVGYTILHLFLYYIIYKFCKMSAPIVGKVTAVVIDGKVTPVAGLAANAQPVAQAYAVRRDEEGSIELPVRPVVNPLQQEQQQREQQQHQREQEQRQQQEEEELKADDIEANIHNHNHNCAHVNDDDGIRVHAEDDPDYEERISVVYDDTRIRETKTAEELEAERKNEIKQHFSFFGGLYRGIKKQFHMKCFIASLFVWIFFFSSFAGGSIVAGFVIFYIIYTIEYCYSSSSVFIKGDIISSNDYLAYYNNVKTNRPQLTHEMDCTKTCSWTEVIETTHTTPAGYDSNGKITC